MVPKLMVHLWWKVRYLACLTFPGTWGTACASLSSF